MRRTLTVLSIGIALGIVLAFASAEIAGGWYVYEVRPTTRCRPEHGPTISVPEPVPYSAHPCLFRRPRWSLIN